MSAPSVGLGRRIALSIVGSVALVLGSLGMLLVAILTLFQARRFYAEVMARGLGRFALWVCGVRLVVHRDSPWPERQTVYMSNHTSTLDLFVLIALGLPNSRFFLSGFLRKIVPLGIIGYLIGIFWTAPYRYPEKRLRIFRRAEDVLRRTGESVFLTPEGSRIRTGLIGHFNRGGFHLATNLNAPIVPIYIHIPEAIDPGMDLVPGKGTVDVYFRPAIETADWTVEDLDRNRAFVRQQFIDLHEELTGRRP